MNSEFSLFLACNCNNEIFGTSNMSQLEDSYYVIWPMGRTLVAQLVHAIQRGS